MSKHKLTGCHIRGDSLKILPRIEPDSVDLILTDPPYAINYRSNRRTSRPKFPHINGDLPGDWIDLFACEAFRVLHQDRHLYCFCRHDTYPLFYRAFEAARFKMKRTLVWVKNNHGSGDLRGDYAPQDEWIIYAHKGRRLLSGKRESNIFDERKVSSADLLHPTQKPLKLLEKLIRKSSKPGEVVLDPFAGVYSTAIAAMNRGRSFRMIENSVTYSRRGRGLVKNHQRFDDYTMLTKSWLLR